MECNIIYVLYMKKSSLEVTAEGCEMCLKASEEIW